MITYKIFCPAFHAGFLLFSQLSILISHCSLYILHLRFVVTSLSADKNKSSAPISSKSDPSPPTISPSSPPLASPTKSSPTPNSPPDLKNLPPAQVRGLTKIYFVSLFVIPKSIFRALPNLRMFLSYGSPQTDRCPPALLPPGVGRCTGCSSRTRTRRP